MSGKGSRRVPTLIPDKQFEENWQRIFGKPEKTPKKKKPDASSRQRPVGDKDHFNREFERIFN